MLAAKLSVHGVDLRGFAPIRGFLVGFAEPRYHRRCMKAAATSPTAQPREGSCDLPGREATGKACGTGRVSSSLPPTSPDLVLDRTRPYFLWWTDATVGDLRARLDDPDLETRAYWMGALLREANTRDVWLYVRPDQIRELWPRLIRYLGRARDMWAYLLELPRPEWPPRTALAKDRDGAE